MPIEFRIKLSGMGSEIVSTVNHKVNVLNHQMFWNNKVAFEQILLKAVYSYSLVYTEKVLTCELLAELDWTSPPVSKCILIL